MSRIEVWKCPSNRGKNTMLWKTLEAEYLKRNIHNKIWFVLSQVEKHEKITYDNIAYVLLLYVKYVSKTKSSSILALGNPSVAGWIPYKGKVMMTSSNGNIFRVAGHLWPVNSPHKGQWRGALVLSLICAWIKGWVNNGEAGDLRCYRAHYDVTVIDVQNEPTSRRHNARDHL